MGLFRAIATVSGLTFLSRILGFVRDIMIATALGAGPIADAFIIAFRLPNLFRRLFAEGAFNAAFVPLFAGRLEQDGEAAARAFAEQAMALLLWALLVFVILFELGMPFAIYFISAGFSSTPEKFDLAVLLTRITFPYLLFISLVSLMAGVLNSMGRFAAAAATPILLNLTLIAALLWLAQFTPTPAHALAWGVTLAGAIQFLWLISHCWRAGMALRLPRPSMSPAIRTMMRRILPGAIGAGVYQINLLVDTNFASFLEHGAITFLYMADRVTQLPLGVVGVAVGTALLPILSRQIRSQNPERAVESQNRALELTLLLTVPAAAALSVASGPITAALFQYQNFTTEAASATAAALAAYSVGLPAYVLIRAITPSYFARGNTATPVKIAAVALVVNFALNIALIGPFRHVGLAFATSAAAWVNFALLAWILNRRGEFVIDKQLRTRTQRIVIASAAMALLLVGGEYLLADLLAENATSRILAVAVLVTGGIVVYAAFAWLIRAATPSELRNLFSRGDGSQAA